MKILRPRKVTFTGFDDRTDIVAMMELSKKYSFIEWGVLWSNHNKDARYPCKQAIEDLTDNTTDNLALHLCGKATTEFQRVGNLDHIPTNTHRFDRLQLNGFQPNIGDTKINDFLDKSPWRECIIQEEKFPANKERLSRLFDTSAGRGILNPFPKYPGYWCGYAGGMGPHNIISVLEYINCTKGDY